MVRVPSPRHEKEDDMAKRTSPKQLQQILDRDLGGKYRLVQGAAGMDSKRKSRRTAVKTRSVKRGTGGTGNAAPRRQNNGAPDAIVFIESNAPAGTDATPLRKVAVVSGGRVSGLQG
jgi:hypothetical protein